MVAGKVNSMSRVLTPLKKKALRGDRLYSGRGYQVGSPLSQILPHRSDIAHIYRGSVCVCLSVFLVLVLSLRIWGFL